MDDETFIQFCEDVRNATRYGEKVSFFNSVWIGYTYGTTIDPLDNKVSRNGHEIGRKL